MTIQEQITKLELEIATNKYYLNDYGMCNEVKIRNRKRTLKEARERASNVKRTGKFLKCISLMARDKEITLIKTKDTAGFPQVLFLDFYNRLCSIEISTLADARCVWVGLGPHRMHLSMEDIQKLLPILEEFAETGHITT